MRHFLKGKRTLLILPLLVLAVMFTLPAIAQEDIPLIEVPVNTNTIVSTFDTDLDNWTANGAYRELQHFATDGNPGGHICARNNSYGPWEFRVAPKFLGDIGFAYGGSLSFDAKQTTRNVQQFVEADIVLVGNGVTLLYDTFSNPGSFWTYYYVSLSETAGWVNQATSSEVTQAEFQAVLANATDLRIRAEYSEEYRNQGCLDNVTLAAPGEVTAPATPTIVQNTFDTTTQNWAVVGNAREFQNVAAGGNPGGHICALNSNYGPWEFRAAPEFLGNISFAYGGSLTFDLKQTIRSIQEYDDADVILVGDGLTLIYDTAYNPSYAWTPYYISMTETGGWINQATGTPVSQSEYQAVLAAVEDLRFRAEYSNEYRYTACIDNATLAAPGEILPPVEPTSVISDFVDDAEGWSIVGAGRELGHNPADGNPGGHLCARNGNYGPWDFLAAPKFLGNISFAYGGSLSFDLIQYITTDQVVPTDDLYLIGNNDVTLVYDLPTTPGTNYTSFEVGMNENSGWINQATEAPVSQADFQEVLQQVRELRISGSYNEDYRSLGCIDNVVLTSEPFQQNTAPVAADDNYSTTDDQTLNVSAANGVLDNDTDADGDTLTAVLTNDVTNGTLTLNNDGSFSYTPNSGFFGADTFTYVANDGLESSNVATVTINVTSSTLQWIAPAGTIQTLGNPTYQWTQVVDATAYEIYVGPGGSFVPGAFFGTVPASVCTGGICSVDLTTQANNLSGDATVSNGPWAVFINPEPGNLNTWLGPFEFTVNTPVPTVPTILSVGNTIDWTLTGNGIYASEFYLYIAPVDDILAAVVNQSVSRAEVCGSLQGTGCSFSANLSSGVNYVMYMNTEGPGGPATGGNVEGLPSWLECKFTVEAGVCTQPASEPTNLNASLEGTTVTLTWLAGDNTTEYSVWLGTLNPVVSTYFDTVQAADLGCEAGGTCTLTVPDVAASGRYSWFVQANGPGGVPQNDLLGWTIGPEFNVP